MKNPRYLNRMAKSTGTRVLALLVMLLLALEPCVFAALIYKYPTGTPTIGSVDMDAGAGVNTLYYGSVFGFNSAKSADDVGAEIREGACIPEATSYTFLAGMDGWTGVTATNISYMYDSVLGSGAIKAVMARRNVTATYTLEKTFFYDCSTPATVNFSMDYSKGIWLYPNATPANSNFSVILVRPDLTTKTLVAATAISNASMAAATITTQPVAADLTQVGTYTLRITGALATVNTNGAKLEVAFDNITLTKTPVSAYSSFQQDVEFTIAATPVSTPGTLNQYLLDIRAKKPVGDGESTYIQVWDGATWNTKYTVSATTWTTFASYYLTPAEYNGGNVRVRYFDATTVGDSSQGGVDVDYQRVNVEPGTCVDSVTDSNADCGKCHNFGGDITKPWPDAGFHNKHAQTESISDCLWCHPSNTYTAEHSNGVVEIDGTKIYKFGTTATKGGTGTYDAATTKTCTTPANGCHKGIQTPSWFSVVGVGGFYQNCARCHNSGSAPGDTLGDLHIDVAWPNDVGQGHLKHDTAFNFDQASCQESGSCHPNNINQHTVVGDGIVEVKMASVYASPNKTPKYIPDTTNGTGTCVNMACHGGMQTPRFNLSSTNPIDVPTQCTKCHLAEKADGWGLGMASQWNSALSGLHRGSPPTSGKSHIADYSCTACHNNPAAHFMTGGVSNLASGPVLATDMDPLTGADFKAVVGYAAGSGGVSPNYTNPPTCSNPLETVGCHAESVPGTGGKTAGKTSSWARRWSWDAYDTVTPANQCKNCHGHWTTFTAGVVAPHASSTPALINNHGDSGLNCGTMCHAQTDPAYNHGVSMTATSKDMTLNSNAGIVKTAGTPGTVGCSFCHSANDATAPASGKHVFAESNWFTDTAALAGPTPTCYNPGASASCHGDGVYKSWPTGSPGSYPNRIGDHQIHLDRLATKLGKNLASITQPDQNTMCLYCHNTLSPGLAGHTTDATASQAEVSSFKRIFDGAADTATGGTFTAADSSCSNVDCHNNKATGVTYAWRGAGTSACIMCHSDVTNVADTSHTAHLAATVPTTFGETLTCATCHDASTNWSTNTKPSLNHLNGTFTTTLYTNATYPSVKGYCNNNTCHNNGKGTATSNNTWGTPRANCTGCHGDATTLVEAHNEHMNNSYTGALCTNCHTSETAATHLNGLVNIDGTKATYSLNSGAVPVATIPNGTCSTASCHNKTGNGSSIAWNVTAGTGAGTLDLSCTSCHYSVATVIAGSDAASQAAPSPISLSHRDHLTKLFQCSRCHTVPTTTTHITNKSSMTSGANAALGEAAVAVTGTTTYAAYAASTCTSGGATPNNGIGCHATGAPVWGTAFAVTACTNCHTNTTNNLVNPTSGLHNNILGLKKHDSTLGTGCIACHTTTATHINGTFTTNEFTTGTNEYYTNALYTDGTALNRGSCTGSSVNIAAGCHVDNGNWARLWSTEANSIATAPQSNRCNVCHGQWSTIAGSVGWRAGTSHYKAGGANVSTNTRGSGHDSPLNCDSCHAYGASGNTRHNVATRSINLNNNYAGLTPGRSGSAYGTDTSGCNAASCHTNGWLLAAYNYPISYFPQLAVSGTAFPALTCTSCHTGSGGGAKNVGPASTHVKVTVGGAFGACTDCHNNHTGAAVGGIIIPNNATVGINYVTTGHTGIQLGGTGTVASISALTNEAAICWGCHDEPANLISEWGANTDPSTGNSPYNYGTVTTYDWTTATWSSSRTQFAYKTGAIQSTHTANPTVTDTALGGAAYSRTETKNTALQIRCTNCHDVHELGLAPGDKKEGVPYLRGSWMANPYEEDGAPRTVYANTTYFATTASFGQVPRASTATPYTKLGGYWIDQNNVTPMTATTAAQGTARLNPTSTWEPLDTNVEAGNASATSPAFAGLCLLCHGTGGTTALKIDALDQVPTEGLWMGTNGHANSVKGGTGSASASSFNVFDARGGVTTLGNDPQQHYNGMVEPANSGTAGFRSNNGAGLKYTPLLAAASTRPLVYSVDNWVVDETGATKESQYHKFSCSKCHNPHASRLPKLMITNCLDTVHNTWDNQFPMVTAASTLNNNRELAQWTSAQNCHRYSESVNATTLSPEYRAGRLASPAGSGAGWNKVTPWKSTSTTP